MVMPLLHMLRKYFSPSTRRILYESRRLNSKRTSNTTIQLSQEQQVVYDLIESTRGTMYITGKAGTGKSFLLQYFVRHTTKNVAVLAPTGLAALNAGGTTIHSFFRFSFGITDPTKVRADYKTRGLLRSIDTIVIDEISMVRVDVLEGINAKLQAARQNEEPFGGVQVVLFGDLYQLPPVVTDKKVYDHLRHTYSGIYFFNAPVFNLTKLKIYELNKAFRQKDPAFRSMLNSIRQGDNIGKVLSQINKRVIALPSKARFITLTTTNATVSAINHSKLALLSAKERTYFATIDGDMQAKSFPTEKELKLKVGAQVMLLKNDQERPMRWANGTLGIITKLRKNAVYVSIDGAEHTIHQETWETIEYRYDEVEHTLRKEITGTFTQFPIRLAWAITIHKSQGQTYESVMLDIDNGAFAHGQTYVALSRCASLTGLYLAAKIAPEDIIVDPNIVDFMKEAAHLGI